MTKTHIDIPDDAKEVNMCKAIEDLINDSKAEGLAQGINKGRAKGITLGLSKGRAEGRSEGITMGKIDLMSGLLRDNFISSKDAAARLNMTEEAFSAMLPK